MRTASMDILTELVASIEGQIETSLIAGHSKEQIRENVKTTCRYACGLMTLLERNRIMTHVDCILAGNKGVFPCHAPAFGRSA